MMLLRLTFLFFIAFVKFALVAADDFAGANSYFLFAVNDADRIAVLDAMQSANMKLLRIFLTRVAEGTKGSSASWVNDVESNTVGEYEDTILRRIDDLAVDAHARGIKLIIAMHDRYSLGCWERDGYVTKYDLPDTGCKSGAPDSKVFYTDPKAVADFDNRLRYILNYKSPNFGVPWSHLSEAIFAFEIQNEAMAHMDLVAPNWWCERAETMREVMGSSKVLISTGGRDTVAASVQDNFFKCKDIDVIALHGYNLDPSYVTTHLNAANAKADGTGKRLIYEEFGAVGDDKSADIGAVVDVLQKAGIPWLYWELTTPGAGTSDFEVWTDEPSWKTLEEGSKATSKLDGQYSWPEIK